ncbi:MAG: hypothetical protein L0220_03480 [Acidobacteria bacterium]|nr:hypothetical protein [Acidobacteriota bacterium]
MSNLQIKGIDDALYAQIKELAASENRSVSQQVLYLVRHYIANQKQFQKAKLPAQILLDLSGSWEDDRIADAIISELKNDRKNSTGFKEDSDVFT